MNRKQNTALSTVRRMYTSEKEQEDALKRLGEGIMAAQKEQANRERKSVVPVVMAECQELRQNPEEKIDLEKILARKAIRTTPNVSFLSTYMKRTMPQLRKESQQDKITSETTHLHHHPHHHHHSHDHKKSKSRSEKSRKHHK